MSVENDKKIEDSFRAIEKEFQEKFYRSINNCHG